jgi:hypothetical protein
MLPVSNDYVGEIVNAELTENDGKVGAVVLCRPDGSPEVVRWYGSFSETVIQSGDNAGKMVGETTAATLGLFGCTDFSKIDMLIGKKVAFGVKHKPGIKDASKIFAEVSWIRPPRAKNPATSAGIASINKFRGAAIEAAKNAPKQPPPAARPAANASRQQREPGDDGYSDFDDQFDPLA